MKISPPICACFVALAFVQPVQAITTNWNSSLNGSFTDPTKWTNEFPTSADRAVFNRNLNVSYNVTFPGGTSLPLPVHAFDQLRVGTNTVNFADSIPLFGVAGTISVTNPSALVADSAIIIGDAAGQVAVLNTTLKNFSGAAATIGNAAGSTGTLNVNAGTFSMTSNINNYVGWRGTGTLNVNNGADVNAAGAVFVGSDSASANGTISVSGAGSTWTGHALVVAVSGTGTLMIQNGGAVSSTDGLLALAPGSNGTATVDGADSIWDINSNLNGNLTVGNDGDGELTIQNGGLVTTYVAVVGKAAGAVGTVTVDGVGSMLTSQDLRIGDYGFATLSITDGGQVSSALVGYIGHYSGSAGMVSIDGAGSTWTNSGDLMVGDGGSGTLIVSNGGTASVSGLLTVGSLGFVRGIGHIAADISNAGQVAPGFVVPANSTGALQIDGSYDQDAAGSLRIQLGGTTPGAEYDQLLVSGAVSLDGTLQVSLFNSFTPTGGQQFTILTADSIVDNGLVLTGPAAGFFNLLVNSTSVILQAIGLAGDYNFDGTVDAADYVVWRKNPGGTFIQNDYNVWSTHFGETAPASGSGATSFASANSATPEPAAAGLALLGLLGLVCHRQRAAATSVRSPIL